MKRISLILLVLFIVVVHIHLNMFTVENVANPSFWVALVLESPPFDGGGWRRLSDILILGILCIVTTFFAALILKWKKYKVWLLSYIICGLVYLLLRHFSDISKEYAISQIYDHIYGYGGAFERCFVYTITQIVYIVTYMLISKRRKNLPLAKK